MEYLFLFSLKFVDFYANHLYYFTVRELSEEEKQMLILSEEFKRFIDRSSRIVERALGEAVDIYTDYTGTMDGDDGMYVTIISIFLKNSYFIRFIDDSSFSIRWNAMFYYTFLTN